MRQTELSEGTGCYLALTANISLPIQEKWHCSGVIRSYAQSSSWRRRRICVNSLFILAEWYAVSPDGTDAGLWAALLLVLPLSVAFLALPASLILAAFRKTRRTALVVCLCCAVYVAVGVTCMRIGYRVRMRAFHNLAERSAPLVGAIHKFEAERGHPLATLQDLVPDFFSEIPKTGMNAYPDYVYLVGEKARQYEDNPWVLIVSTPSAGINFDVFVYFPRGNYPKYAFGGRLERISDWAYCHE